MVVKVLLKDYLKIKSTLKGTIMNTIAATELKRHGISAVDKLLDSGPVHVIKRSRPYYVILTEREFERLTRAAAAGGAEHSMTVSEWFNLSPLATLEKENIDLRLADERDSWEQS